MKLLVEPPACASVVYAAACWSAMNGKTSQVKHFYWGFMVQLFLRLVLEIRLLTPLDLRCTPSKLLLPLYQTVFVDLNVRGAKRRVYSDL